ncbi:MAG TPA: DUF5668 domain-containing protein [Thermoanaerobaculia bacterium]|nr:DUF5668 domain-containing protein [Thermoanaerobaculia bacterium]
MSDTIPTPQAPPTDFPAPAPPPPPPVAFGPSAARPVPGPGAKSPGAAGALGMLPGLGHLYLGLYQRAAIFFGVFALMVSLAEHSAGPFPGILFPFLFAFSIIDAVRQAKAINATGAPEPGIVGGEAPAKVSGSLTVGILLVLIGGFLLLNRFVTIDLSFLNDWWPALLVLFGGWQIFAYWKAKQDAPRGD